MSRSAQRLTVSVVESHDNTSQEVIVITRDKLELVVRRYKEKEEDSKSWQMPAGLLVTIVLVFCTANFQEFLKLKSEFWQAFFGFAALCCLVWLIRSLSRLRKSPSISELLDAAANKQSS